MKFSVNLCKCHNRNDHTCLTNQHFKIMQCLAMCLIKRGGKISKIWRPIHTILVNVEYCNVMTLFPKYFWRKAKSLKHNVVGFHLALTTKCLVNLQCLWYGGKVFQNHNSPFSSHHFLQKRGQWCLSLQKVIM